MRTYISPLQKKTEFINQIESVLRNSTLERNETDSTNRSMTKADFVSTLSLELEIIGKLKYYHNSITFWQSADLCTDEKVKQLTPLIEKYEGYCNEIEARINNHLK